MAEEAQQQQQGFPGAAIFHFIFKAFMLHMVMSMFISPNRPGYDPVTGKPHSQYKNFFNKGEKYDLFVYVNEDGRGDFENLKENSQHVFTAENQVYEYSFNRPFDVTSVALTVPKRFQEDEAATLYAVVYVVPHKAYRRKQSPFYLSDFTNGFDGHMIVESIPLTMMREIKKSKEVSLIGGGDENEKDDADVGAEVCRHWIPRLDISLVYDITPHVHNPQDPYLQSYKRHQKEHIFDPKVMLSQFWILEEHYQSAKATATPDELKLDIHLGICSPTYYLFITQFQTNMEKGGIFGNQSAKEFDMFKRTVMTTNIYMLIFSASFIMLHSVFSFFALKNDIQFWHQNESMEGLSALSVVCNFICELIIALYIFDSENVSWLLLFEIAIGVIASAWKVSKALKVSFKREFPFINLDSEKDYVESNTKKYDEVAIKYMSIALFPCVAAYAVYSLLYEKHKSWYSYVISVAAGSVYAFGFIMMTPQIYINYKLKSVDHLPWRALIYKSLNTFVDDVASFLIDMPWLHRLSCFRDDIIFFIYLYQRWAYKVDHSRSNAWNQGSNEVQNAPAQPIEGHNADGTAEEATTNLDKYPEKRERKADKPTKRR